MRPEAWPRPSPGRRKGCPGHHGIDARRRVLMWISGQSERETGVSPTIHDMPPPPIGGMSRKHINRSFLDVEKVSERDSVSDE